jgi:hypothetical protein
MRYPNGRARAHLGLDEEEETRLKLETPCRLTLVRPLADSVDVNYGNRPIQCH